MILNILIRVAIILPLFQTWLYWNGVDEANYFDHILYFALIVALFFATVIKNPKIDRRVSLVLTLFFIFLGLGLLNTVLQNIIYSYNSLQAVGWEVYKVTRNVFVFLLAYFFQTKNDFLKTIKLYLIVTTIMVAASLFQYFMGIKAYEIMRFLPSYDLYPDFYRSYTAQGRTFGLLSHPNSFGEFVSVAFLFLLIAISFKEKIFKNNLLHYLLLAFFLVGVFVSSSRGAFLLCIVIPILISLLLNLKKLRRIYVGLIVVTLPFGIYALNQLLFKLWQYQYYIGQGQVETRLMNWYYAYEIFLDKYLLGAGFGTWGEYSAIFSNYVSPSGSSTHLSDSYMSHLIAEHGVLNIFIVALVIFSTVYFSRTVKRTNDKFVKSINAVGVSLILFLVLSSIRSMQISVFENSFIYFYIFGFIFKINYEKSISEDKRKCENEPTDISA